PYGPMLASYLGGEYGPVSAGHPRLAALLYALDRRQAAAGLREGVAAGEVLLADRYLFSNIAYQCARVADPGERAALEEWIEQLEYAAHGIPRADLTLYLDVPPAFARNTLAGPRTGAERDYLQGNRDLHEDDTGLQDRVRDEFRRLARERPAEIGIIDCRGPGGGMADRQTIHARIVDALRYYDLLAV
ncbi:MAG: thymidylate kinase, partial [Planctomycetes bacterium]|nr:thymidylate kinase [Planctomycetota bacterium]